jgi:hypothetical protein
VIKFMSGGRRASAPALTAGAQNACAWPALSTLDMAGSIGLGVPQEVQAEVGGVTPCKHHASYTLQQRGLPKRDFIARGLQQRLPWHRQGGSCKQGWVSTPSVMLNHYCAEFSFMPVG